MIRGVLFDLGDTLITARDNATAFQIILKEKGVDRSLEDIKRAHEAVAEDFTRRHRDLRPPATRDFNEVYAEWNGAIVKELGVRKKGLGKYINQRWFHVVGLRACDDSATVLHRLSAMGLRIGIVTNGYRDEVGAIFDIIDGPLRASMFDVIVGRNTAGAGKPDPRPFLHAAGSLGLRPDEIIFVGDKYEMDYIGSQGAGMTPVLILRGRKLPAGVPDDVTTIQTLDELMPLIL